MLRPSIAVAALVLASPSAAQVDEADARSLLEPYLEMHGALAADEIPEVDADHEALAPVTTAVDLAGARAAFAALSDRMVELLRPQGRLGRLELVVMECPMASGGAGARWIQRRGPVANPYFGPAMLGCGAPLDDRAGSPAARPGPPTIELLGACEDLGRALHDGELPAVAVAATDLEQLLGATGGWTCSMHPRIRLPGPDPCPICGMDLIVAEPEIRWDRAARDLRRLRGSRDIAAARRAYASLSRFLLGLLFQLESSPKDGPVLFHDPAALDGEGAYWLQGTGEPVNPYSPGRSKGLGRIPLRW